MAQRALATVLAMTSILGLPAHALLAHIPVVLIPLAAIGAILMLWPTLRDRIGWFVVAIVFVAGISTQLVISSGKSLREYVRDTPLVRAHTHMGENIRPWVLLMFLALVGWLLVDRAVRRRAAAAATVDGTTPAAGDGRDRLRIAGITLAVLSTALSAMSVYWIYRIGHSGAKAVWAPTQTKIDKGIREPRHERNAGGGG